MSKKGTPPQEKSKWHTAPMMGELKVPTGYRGRWVNSDSMNVARKESEGWKPVNSVTFPEGKRVNGGKDNEVVDGSKSATQYRELVGYCLPIEDDNGDGRCVREREKWVQERTEEQTKSIMLMAKDRETEIGRSANLKPTLKIN